MRGRGRGTGSISFTFGNVFGSGSFTLLLYESTQRVYARAKRSEKLLISRSITFRKRRNKDNSG